MGRDIVFILGAGASVAAGAPLMDNFLLKAQDLIPTARGETPAKKDLELVLAARSILARTHTNTSLNLDNLEELYSAFESWEIMGIPTGDAESDTENIDPAALAPALSNVIAETLRQSVKIPFSGSRLKAHGYLNTFIKRLGGKDWPGDFQDCSFITFNYDIALDMALSANGVETTYGLDGNIRIGQTPLLKLHGSVNWYGDEKTDKIHVVEMESIVRQRHPAFDDTYRELDINMLSFLKNAVKPEDSPRDVPLLIPPTMSKLQHQSKLRECWQSAREYLSNAKYVAIIGYSMPANDQFFRHLLALGLFDSLNLRQMIVINPSESVEETYFGILSEQMRKKVHFVRRGFEEPESLGWLNESHRQAHGVYPIDIR